MTKFTVTLCTLLALAGGGCAYGPEHLPALSAQRDVFQREIDVVLKRMRTDVEWWKSLTPERRAYWKQFMEKSLADERDRALTCVEILSEGLATAASVEPASPRP